ncbi:UDP-glycosyltransferase 72E1 [Abeliophyllum distichum]|uniref:Glycosyltransferase n=1 Tax=Abeliophyllum distichum TaxID=126358 RepID=A0ABD1Q6E0_9LAMI
MCHVAFLSSPGMGHIIPLFQFAKHLVHHHGVRVSFLVITVEASAAQYQFFHSAIIPPELQVINIPQPDMAGIITDDMLLLTQLCVITQESLKPLKFILAELNPKALVIDIFATQAIDVCEELSIPVYSFFTASATLLTFSLYLPTLDSQTEGEFVDLPGPVEVPGCPPIRTEDLLDQVRNRKNEEYRWYLFHVSRMSLVAGILANTWQDLERDALKALKENPFFGEISTPPLYPIGPLIKDDEFLTDNDAEIISWLDNQPSNSVLFISLGSGGTLSSKQLTELAWGLEMSQQRFILVARKPTDASASGAFFSAGSDENDPSAYLPDGFIQKTREFALVISSWAPQVTVLRHESTGAFMSHCGWNSTLESLVHGVPMIAWPLYAEQRMNATLLAEEVGVAVKPVAVPGDDVIRREEVERVVRAVMEGEQGKAIRGRARELKESARKISEKGGLSYNSTCHVVEHWNSQG